MRIRQSFELKYPNVGEYDAEEALAYEKEVLGIYLSGHPLEKICSYPKEKHHSKCDRFCA